LPKQHQINYLLINNNQSIIKCFKRKKIRG